MVEFDLVLACKPEWNQQAMICYNMYWNVVYSNTWNVLRKQQKAVLELFPFHSLSHVCCANASLPLLLHKHCEAQWLRFLLWSSRFVGAEPDYLLRVLKVTTLTNWITCWYVCIVEVMNATNYVSVAWCVQLEFISPTKPELYLGIRVNLWL